MKKLKLNLQSLNAEVLTRSQLKMILGGDGSGLVWKVKCNDGNLYEVASCSATNQSAACSTHGGVVAGPSCTGY